MPEVNTIGTDQEIEALKTLKRKNALVSLESEPVGIEVSPSQYDVGYVLPETDTYAALAEHRAQQQSSLSKLGSGVAKGLANLPLGVIQGASVLLDPDFYAKVISGNFDEYTNSVSDAINEAKKVIEESIPVYRTEASKGFSPGSSGWWAYIIPSVIESASLFLPGYAVTKVLSLLGKAGGGTKLLKTVGSLVGVEGQTIGKGLSLTSTATLSRMNEQFLQATDAAKNWKLDNQGRVNPDTGIAYSDEELNQMAGEIANTTFYSGLPLAALDMLQLNTIFKGFKGFREARRASLDKSTGSLLKSMAGTAGPETLDEAIQFVQQKEAEYEQDVKTKKVEESTFSDRLLDYTKDGEMWTAAFGGAFGGAIMYGAGRGLARREDKIQQRTQNQAEDIARVNEAVLKGDKQAFHKASDIAFGKAVIQHIQDNTIDSFKENLEKLSRSENEFLTGDELNDKEFYKRLQSRIETLDTIDKAFYDIQNDSEVSPELKHTKLSTIIDQRLTQNRINHANTDLNDLLSDDLKSGFNAGLTTLKKLQTEYLASVDNPRISAKDKAALGKALNKAYNDAITIDPRFEEMEVSDAREKISKELVTGNDSEILKITKAIVDDKLDLEEAKETLRKLSDKTEAAKLTKEINEKRAKAGKELRLKNIEEEYSKPEVTLEGIEFAIESEKSNEKPDTDILAVLEKVKKIKQAQPKTPLASQKQPKVVTKEDLIAKKSDAFYKETFAERAKRFPQYDLTEMREDLKKGELIMVDKNGKEITTEDYLAIQKLDQEIEDKYYPKTSEESIENVIAQNLAGSYPTEDEQHTREVEVSTGDEKTMGKRSGVIMMHLYQHFRKAGKFLWSRLNGSVEKDNISNIDEAALKDLKVKDEVTFKLKTLSEQEKTLNDPIVNSIPENKPFPLEGFHESIGIYNSEGKFLGTYQLPHEVVARTNEEIIDFNKRKQAREQVIKERKLILSKLKAGEIVTGKVQIKGTGKLLTKLTPEGKVDVNADNGYNTIFNEITSRPQDLHHIGKKGIAIFVHTDDKGLTFGKYTPEGMNKATLDKISRRLKELGKWAPKGNVFMLVKAQNDEWYPVPVYSTKITQSVAEKISAEISKITHSTEPKEVTARLNKYVFTSQSGKPGSLRIQRVYERGKDTLKFTVAGNEYLLDDIDSRKDQFIADLQQLKQNIDIKGLNTFAGQAELKANRTLTTNAYTENGEYLVQPYIELAQLTQPEVQVKTEGPKQEKPKETAKEVVEGERTELTAEDLNALLGKVSKEALNKEVDLDVDPETPALKSKTKLDVYKKEDREKLKKFLQDNLPAVTLSDLEDFSQLKGNLRDSWGFYKKMVIAVQTMAPKGTGYHEAFHAVFRSMLTLDEKYDLIEEASNRFKAPTQEDLDALQTEDKKFTESQLTWLYYEEKLADEFADFQNKLDDKGYLKSLGEKIRNFFNKILKFFGVFSKNDPSKIDDIFNKISKGEFKEASIRAKGKFELVEKELKEEYARSPIKGFSAMNKAHFVRSIKGEVLQEVQALYAKGELSGKDAKSIDKVIKSTFKKIKDSYTAIIQNAEQDKRSEKEVAGAANIVLHFNRFEEEVIKELIQDGVVGKRFELSTVEEEINETEENEVEGNETKGFRESSSIPGLKKASKRLKIFLSAIPAVDESGNIKKDIFGKIVYTDFSKIYYYIERNLTGKYSWSEQLDHLKALSVTRPEIKAVVKRIEEPEIGTSEEYLQNLINDFKTNFSKQQKAAMMLSYTRSGEGLSYRIFEANRQNLGIEIYSEWEGNLSNPEKNTISEFKEGKIHTFGTERAKTLLKDWELLSKEHEKEIPVKKLNKILFKAGIEYSPEVAEKISNDVMPEIRDAITSVLEWYASDKPEMLQTKGRKALYVLVNIEVANKLTRFTSSYNNAEGEIVNTIQLPSYASRLVSQITDSNQFYDLLDEFYQEGAYRHNNILMELESNVDFRENNFHISDLSGLSQSKIDSKGAVFSKMSPKDFMSVSIALYQNTFINKGQAQMKMPLANYVYLTPADKKQQMVFSGRQYIVKRTEGKLDTSSEIVDKFYHRLLSEAERIQNALKFKEKIKLAEGEEKEKLTNQLSEFYHYKGENKTAYNGLAFEFNYFDFDKTFSKTLKDSLEDLTKSPEEIMASFEESIREEIVKILEKEVETVTKEAADKALIINNNGILTSLSIEKSTLGENEHDGLKDLLDGFALNQLLHNIDMSHILNGDVALYKANQLQKRTYQSVAQISNGNFEKDTIKIKAVKDRIIEVSPHYDVWKAELTKQGYTKDQIAQKLSSYKEINSTDAGVFGSAKFFERFMREEGRWTPDVELAVKIANEEIKGTPEQLEAAQQVIRTVKPFGFGRRFNPETKIWEYYQIKCAITWLFPGFTKDNEFLDEQAELMNKSGTELLVPESAFKAFMPNREALEDLKEGSYSDDNTFTIRREDFGIQTENPNKGVDEVNDGLRQFKMILLGMIDPDLSYSETPGEALRDTINTLEGQNIKEAKDKFIKALSDPTATDFKELLAEELQSRTAPDNLAKSLELVGPNFRGALNFGPTSLAAQYMLSSLLRKRVIKQGFAGGSFVQASSLGVKGGTLKAQQKEIEKNPELAKLQSTLKHIIPTEGQTELAEVILPAYASVFFNEEGTPVDIDKIPEELKQLICYRIPVEGPHSMLTVKVVGFLSREQGNYILMPNEVVAQWGSDFDFDKAYFVHKHLYKNKEGKLKEVKYEENKQKAYDKFILGHKENFETKTGRYKETSEMVESLLKSFGIIKDIEDYTVEELNSKEARDNKIIDSYMSILRSPHAFPHIISPSGFKQLVRLRNEIVGTREKPNFFSGTTQRNLKQNNSLSSKIRALAALAVTGHTGVSVMGGFISVKDQYGAPDKRYELKFNKKITDNLSSLYNEEKQLIIDELGSILAATVDDIKDPILEDLGITDTTIHVIGTIVRAGYGLETAVNLTTQPVIKELSERLIDSYSLTRDIGQKRVNIEIILKEYNSLYDQVASKLAAPPEKSKLTNTYNLEDSDMEKWREFSKDKKFFDSEGKPIVITPVDTSNVNANQEADKHNYKLAEYLGFQIKVLKRFDAYNKIGQALNKINLYLQINNNPGGTFEQILQKQYLLDEIMSDEFPIAGIDFTKLRTIAESQDAMRALLKNLEEEFPFSSQVYGDIKTELVHLQKKAFATNKDLTKIKAEDRTKIDNFIGHHLLLRHPFFQKLSDESEKKRILTDVSKLLTEIKNPENSQYNQLRKNDFIENTKVRYEEGHKKLGSILSRAVKLEPLAQNVLSENFYALYNSNAELKKEYTYKQFAEELIKYSFLSSGLYTGKQSYHNLITFEAFEELGIISFIKETNSKLHKDKLNITPSGRLNVVDQLIRNFPKFFTNVYDSKMFSPITKEKVPLKIQTTDAEIKKNNRLDFIIGIDEAGQNIYPKYIRIFNNTVGKAALYRQGEVQGVYELIHILGIPGKSIEISIDEIKNSIFPTNDPSYTRSEFTQDDLFAMFSKADDEGIFADEEGELEDYQNNTESIEEPEYLQEASEEDILKIIGKKLPPINPCK